MAIIAISRGSYSGGRTLAECVAERLGYPCLGREGVLEAAAAYGVPVEKLTVALEQPPSFWQRLTGYRVRYLNYVQAALCGAALESNLVYHGHAGHLVLPPEVSHVLRVRVVADKEYRIDAAMRRQNLGRREAIAYIKKVDRERVLWTRFLYGVEWGNPSLYDVVLNIQRMDIPGACETLARMVELDAFKPTAQSVKAMEDLTLGSHVWAVLASAPATAAADLEVRADNGVVTIAGVTPYPSVFEAIHPVAAQVQGVREVRCEVRETSRTYP